MKRIVNCCRAGKCLAFADRIEEPRKEVIMLDQKVETAFALSPSILEFQLRFLQLFFEINENLFRDKTPVYKSANDEKSAIRNIPTSAIENNTGLLT